MNAIANGLMAASVVLLVLCMAGALRRFVHEGRSLRRFVDALPDPDAAGAASFCVELSERLTARFRQGVSCYSSTSNWLLWLSKAGPRRYAVIERTEDLFLHAGRTQCHQIAQAFVDVATEKGLPARIVGLDGHVIAEAFYDGEWHAFDPDYGVILRHEGRVVTIEELIASPVLADELYRGNRVGKNDLILPILARGRVVRSLPGEHLSPRTSRWQARLGVLKWLLPMAGLTAGLILKRIAGTAS